MFDHPSFLAVFVLTVVGFAYALVVRRGALIVAGAVSVAASAEMLTNAGSLSGFGWSVDILVSAAVLLTEGRRMRVAVLRRLPRLDFGLAVVLAYGGAVSLMGVVLHSSDSLIRLACLMLVYLLGARVIGGLARTAIESGAVARVVLFVGWVAPAAVLVGVTAISALLGAGSDAAFDFRTPIRLGPFSTPRLLNTALGPTFLGHTSLLVLFVLTFALFNTRSRAVRALVISVWLGYFVVLLWSGTRTALVAGWFSCCGTLLIMGLLARRRRARRRARCALVIALCLPFGDVEAISRFLTRSSGDVALDFGDLYKSERGRYMDNAYRWVGYGSYDSLFGAGLGAGTVITRDSRNVSSLQTGNQYGLIEPFFELIGFEWGYVGGFIYAAYWLWLSWLVLREDLRDVRMGKPWAGLIACWLLYIWAGAVTSFGFGIVNTTVLFMFGVSRLVAAPGRSAREAIADSLLREDVEHWGSPQEYGDRA